LLPAHVGFQVFIPAILSKADQTAIVVSGPTTSIAGPASPLEFAAVLMLL
jgi:hypothetical protein